VRRALSRLRWQLTLSHLVAIAFTLVSMIAATILITTGWVAVQNTPSREPAFDARIIAGAVTGLVVRGQDADLNAVLRSLVSGRIRVLAGPGPFAPEPAYRVEGFGPSLRNLAYIVVIGPDGRVLGSSDQSGAAFAPPERSEWQPLAEAALGGELDPRRLVSIRSGSGPVALGAYPVFEEPGRALAAVVVAKSELPSPDRFGNFWRGLAIFSAATVAVLASAFVFALASSSLVAYLLSRRLVARLERLGRAAEELASGDLASRVEEGPQDEVGQLAQRFNSMAKRLAATVAELEDEKRHAEELLDAKRELVANVSHELRTPLASIRAHVESLLMQDREPVDPRRSEYLEVIHRETEHLSRLVDDLFALSTAEAGALPLRLQPLALADVIEDVAGAIRDVARRERQVAVVTRVEPDLPPALADRQRVAQALGNLVRNALRHTPEGGLISVRGDRRNGQLTLTVEDTGVGIPPDQLPHVFERFYRGDAARDRASGGAGLGLAIVRELVEAMGGAVSVESKVAEGSRFSFTLPAANPSRDRRPRGREEAASSPRSRERGGNV